VERPHHLIRHKAHDPELQAHPHRWLALWFICLTILISTLDMTTLNVALPQISRSLHASTTELQWIIDSYTLVLAGFLLLGGGLGDRYGRRGAFVAGAALFGFATIGASISTNPTQLIIARSIMGLGAALFMPAALSLIAVLFPPAERSRALLVWIWAGAIGTAGGPVVAGLLVDSFGWSSVFLVTVPPVVVAAIGVATLAPKSKESRGVHLDFGGALLSVIGLSVLVYSLIGAPERGWLSAATLVTFTLGSLIAAGFVVFELRNQFPMFDVRVFRIGPVVAGATFLFTAYVAFLGMLFLVPQYLQFVRGFDSLSTGLWMMPLGVVIALASLIEPRLFKLWGSRVLLAVAMSLLGFGMAVLSAIGHEQGESLVLIGLVIVGVGLGIAFVPATATVLDALPLEKAGDGSSVNQIMRQVGAAFGVAILGSVFSAVFTSRMAPALVGVPPATAAEARTSVGAAETCAQSLSGEAAQTMQLAIRKAFADGAQLAFIVAAAICAVGVIVIIYSLREAPERTLPGDHEPDL
jgi:EmrB/QacA subfamily drug resistance transporter